MMYGAKQDMQPKRRAYRAASNERVLAAGQFGMYERLIARPTTTVHEARQ
ncbi:MAG TPA: hypothetical protein VHB49_22830 [Bradyrhizobium sp.]|nr:hypothetical protein [Bradyrhizobium sp.]